MLRRHVWLILMCVLIGAGAAVAFVTITRPVYTAETDLFISPITSADTATVALGLITASGNPTGDVETAARLVTIIDAARAAKTALGLHESPQEILHQVTATPVAQSNIVALTAEAHSPDAAANLANAFATAVIAQRTAQFHALIKNETTNLNAQIASVPPASAAAGVLGGQLDQLRSFLATPLPDMRISTLAVPPTSRSSPHVALTVAGGVIGGLALGVALAFVLEFLDVRLRSEQQLHRLFRLPVLALIPREGRTARGLGRFRTRLILGRPAERRRVRRSTRRAPELMRALARARLELSADLAPHLLPPTYKQVCRGPSPAALEAYRTLRATLVASRSQSRAGHSILVTSASAGDGKTTTAMRLALTFATSGATVILIEADLRGPSIAGALGLESRHDVSSVLTGEVPMSAALLESPSYGPRLSYLLAHNQQESDVLVGDALSLPTAATLVSEALQLADFVIVDAPPLTEVIDAVEIARRVDDVLIVVMLDQTAVPRLTELGELLVHTDITPAGIALIGARSGRPHTRASRAGGAIEGITVETQPMLQTSC